MRKTAPPNRRRRFSRKTGFGEHEEAQSRSARKIFFLPKSETQSPRNTPSAGLDKPDDVSRASITECTSNENTCGTVASCELTIVDAVFSRTICIASTWCRHVAVECVRCARQLLINTSLSETLFFWMRWCIRDVVHLDSRVHAAIKPSHLFRRATWPRKLRRQRRRRAQ